MSEIRGLPAAIAERLRTGALIQVGNEIMPRADALRRFGDSVLAVPPGGRQVERLTVEGDRDELVKPGAVTLKPTGKIRFPNRLANLFTLVENCRQEGVNPEAYLIDIIARLPDHPMKRIAELLPRPWKLARTSPPVPAG